MAVPPAAILAQIDRNGASFHSADDAATLAVLNTAVTLLGTTGDVAFILALGQALLNQPALANPDLINKGVYSGFFAALDAYFNANTASLLFGLKPVTNLDLYASYQNAAALDSFLVDPNSAHLYFLSRQAQASGLLTPGNVFAPLTTFGSVSVGASAVLTLTPGAAPNSIPPANATTGPLAQGYTASKGLVALVTTAIGGSLTVTVTGNGRSAAGALVSGRTWTAVLDSAAAGASPLAFTPTVAGDRIASISSVSGSGSAGSGAFALQSVLERVVS